MLRLMGMLMALLLAVALACGSETQAVSDPPGPTPTPSYDDYREAVDEYVAWCGGEEYQNMVSELHARDIYTYGALADAVEVRLGVMQDFDPPELIQGFHDYFINNSILVLGIYREKVPYEPIDQGDLAELIATDGRFSALEAEFGIVEEELPGDLMYELMACISTSR